jgi:hypothetical protein
MKKELFTNVSYLTNQYTLKLSKEIKIKYPFLKTGNIIDIFFNKEINRGLIIRFKGSNIFNYTIKLLLKIDNSFIIKSFFLFDKRIKDIKCYFNNTIRMKSHLSFLEKHYFDKKSKKNKSILNNRFKILIRKLSKK